MIIAESPSTDDDDAGKPIVGRAGELLTQIIEAIELKRNDLYIVNIIKCKTPSNRRPTENEVDNLGSFMKSFRIFIDRIFVCGESVKISL